MDSGDERASGRGDLVGSSLVVETGRAYGVGDRDRRFS